MKNKYSIIKVLVITLFSISCLMGKSSKNIILANNQTGINTGITHQHEHPEKEQTAIVITNVTIIDGVASTAKPDMMVTIIGNIISSIGKNGQLSIPNNAKIIDGAGKFLIPGLWDSHVHLSYADESALKHFLYYGITSVRDMGSNLTEINNWRSQIQEGNLIGPRILTSGQAIESPQFIKSIKKVDEILDITLSEILLPTRLGIGTKIEAKNAIDSLVSNGVDYIKVRTFQSSEVFYAILYEAKKKELL